MKRIALLDWDNSLHRGLTLRSWTRYLRERDVLPRSTADAIEERYAAYEDGEFPYRRLALETPELYARGLEGIAQAELQAHARSYGDEDARALFPFSGPLLESLTERGIETVVISGSPIETLAVHQERLPISQLWGITVAVRDGSYTGELERNPAEQSAKDHIISTALQDASVVLAVGDSEADIPMLEMAKARIVVGNDALITHDEPTLHLAPDTTDDGGIDAMRAFIVRTLGD